MVNFRSVMMVKLVEISSSISGQSHFAAYWSIPITSIWALVLIRWCMELTPMVAWIWFAARQPNRIWSWLNRVCVTWVRKKPM